jgi:hypothetical protein
LRSGLRSEAPSGWLASALLIASVSLASPAGRVDELQDYAHECDRAIQETVPAFDCDAGTDVPLTHPLDSSGQPVHGTEPDGSIGANQYHLAAGTLQKVAQCDKPNRLNRECDPKSRFQVLKQSEKAYIVAHCRKQGHGSGEYGDIAVIQYNRKNGATCFYQALGDLPGGKSFPGADPAEMPVKAPSSGRSAWYWKKPHGTAFIGCVSCHDNGPFIRSPYLNQVTGPNALPGGPNFPGTESPFSGFNGDDQPYSFVGKDFASWKAFTVVVPNECNACHRLGASNIKFNQATTEGTGFDFALRATASSEAGTELSETAKNPPSADSPIWMPPLPPQTAFNPAHANSAKAIHDCAALIAGKPDAHPIDTAGCKITQFAGPFSAPVIDLEPVYYLLLDRASPPADLAPANYLLFNQ